MAGRTRFSNGSRADFRIFFVNAQNHRIPLTGSYGLFAKATKNILKTQFLQEEKGKVVLKIVRKKLYSDMDTNKIADALTRKYGSGIDFIIQFVDDIPRTARGKHQYLVQKLNIADNQTPA